MSKKGGRVFQGKNRGVTPSVAALGVTHPSDVTASIHASAEVPSNPMNHVYGHEVLFLLVYAA